MPTGSAYPITVAFDGSADSERALQWGVDLAREHHAPLTVRIPSQGEFDDYLSAQWAAEAEALLSFCGLDDWSVDVKATPFDAGSVLVLPTQGRATEFAVTSCPYLAGTLSGSLSGAFPGDVPPVVTVRGALDATSTRVVVGIREVARARQAIGFGYDHADWIGGSVHLVDLTGSVRQDVRDIVDELTEKHPHLSVTVSSVSAPFRLVELSREAILLVVAADASSGAAELLRAEAACSVAVVG